jgi:hypothetical protein
MCVCVGAGVWTFKEHGAFEFVVPKGMRHLKIQAWGGGGGSGLLHGSKYGHGGGGAFIEGLCAVDPGETLLLTVAQGGQGGVFGSIQPSETSVDGLPLVQHVRHQDMSNDEPQQNIATWLFDVVVMRPWILWIVSSHIVFKCVFCHSHPLEL